MKGQSDAEASRELANGLLSMVEKMLGGAARATSEPLAGRRVKTIFAMPVKPGRSEADVDPGELQIGVVTQGENDAVLGMQVMTRAEVRNLREWLDRAEKMADEVASETDREVPSDA